MNLRVFIRLIFLFLLNVFCIAQTFSHKDYVDPEIPKHSKYFSLKDTLFYEGQVFISKNKILFDLGKPTIMKESFPTLDSIAMFLMNHLKIKIEVGSHLDCRGDWRKRSDHLSQNRSQSVVDYLIAKGISIERLTAKGYNDLKPFVLENGQALTCKYINTLKTKEEQEAAHSKNRRVELKIIGL